MLTYHPSRADYRLVADARPVSPVYCRLMADLLTPVAAFARLVARGDSTRRTADADYAFLLESVVGGEQVARYSFVGVRPAAVFRVKGRVATIERSNGSVEMLGETTDPLGALESLLAPYRATGPAVGDSFRDDLPRFTGGAVGYAGYDTIRYYERLPGAPTDDRRLDDLAFGIYDEMIVFDHAKSVMLVIAHTRPEAGGADARYADACRRIDELVRCLRTPGTLPTDEIPLDEPAEIPFESNVTQPTFEAAVRKAKDYILSGDIFQVVLSQRLRVQTEADPFNVYRALRSINPSPFMFYLKSPACTLVGASPEILCRVEDGVVTNRPLAGTRPRGRTPAEDAALERELLADPKDRAEHIMLVDLGRNDVGRVAAPGSVRLSDAMTIERYSHVMHICSNVTGRLAPGKTAVDALRAALPVGTVSGAPKIRAMQIIDELEPVRRGPYGGAVGYLDFGGNMDTCIALRTMVVTPGGDAGSWIVDIQAGAGIVADSDPAAEYEETLNKARALLAAVAAAGPKSSQPRVAPS